VAIVPTAVAVVVRNAVVVVSSSCRRLLDVVVVVVVVQPVMSRPRGRLVADQRLLTTSSLLRADMIRCPPVCTRPFDRLRSLNIYQLNFPKNN